MKNFKNIKTSVLAAILALLVLAPLTSAATLAPMPSGPDSKIHQPTIDKLISVNGTDYLLSKGYSEKTVLDLTNDTATKLLLSSGGAIMNKSKSQICMDLFGNSTGPTTISLNQLVNLTIPSTNTIEQSTEIEQYSPQSSGTGGTACMIVSIWEYADDEDLFYNEAGYNAALYNAQNNANYACIATLVNEQARHDPIWELMAYLCDNYDFVDVYFFGHGLAITPWNFVGYMSFDAVDETGVQYLDKVYYPNELYSYFIHNNDFSELRLGVGSFCGSFCFMDSFLYSYGSHVPLSGRVWIGAHVAIEDWYGAVFVNYFGYYWYSGYVTSLASRNSANTNTVNYYLTYWGWAYSSDVLDHFDSTGAIYYS
jgi:hypothetical protein